MFNNILKFFKKSPNNPEEFKVRISLHTPGSPYYVIEYKDDKVWTRLYEWHYLSHDPSYKNMSWNPVLLRVKEAEEFARTFQSIDDVNEFDNKQQQIREFRIKIHNDYLHKINPFNVKELL